MYVMPLIQLTQVWVLPPHTKKNFLSKIHQQHLKPMFHPMSKKRHQAEAESGGRWMTEIETGTGTVKGMSRDLPGIQGIINMTATEGMLRHLITIAHDLELEQCKLIIMDLGVEHRVLALQVLLSLPLVLTITSVLNSNNSNRNCSLHSNGLANKLEIATPTSTQKKPNLANLSLRQCRNSPQAQ
jgi:hypothetical protein